MLFKPEHIKMILNGTKTATRRTWEKRMVKVGGIYKCKTKMLSKNYFAKIRVTNLFEQELGAMTDEDARKEGYKDIEDFRQIWIKINGSWYGDKVVSVIEFELVKEKDEA